MNKSKVLTGTMSFFSALSVLFTIQLVFSCKTSDVLPGRVPYREFVDSARKVSNAHAVFTIPNKRKYLADGGMTYDDLRARMVLARTFGSKSFLEELWKEVAPEERKDTPLVLDEQKLRRLMTDEVRKGVDSAYRDATEQTLWERITKTNHKDVTYYKGLLMEYTRDLLMVLREDFLEEITGVLIKNKTFEYD